MNKASFQPGFPGTLVKTTGYQLEIRGGLQERVPVEGIAFVPHDLPPSFFRESPRTGLEGDDAVRFMGELFEPISVASETLVRLEGVVGVLPNPSVLLRSLRRREVQRSSTIENTIASIEELALTEVDRRRTHSEAQEVYNNLRAVETALESPLPLCVRLLCDAHRELMDGVRGEDKRPGELRKTQVHIAGSSDRFADARFVPAPPGDHLTRCVASLELFINRGASRPTGLHWLVELAMLHYQFETIHPFSDGNGRLGRMLVNVAPVKLGHLKFPIANISEYFADHRDAYYEGLLRVSTHNAWGNWVRLFCTAVARQAASDLARARHLLKLRESYFARFSDARSSVLSHELVDMIFEELIVDAARVAKRLKVTAPTAQKHIKLMVQAGIIREITGLKSDRLYAGDEIIRVLDAHPDALGQLSVV